MSIFKEHKMSADRSATDRRRHKEKIEKAIREGIHHIVADESIIGQDGKKKIRIPVRGIKEYRFVYGENDKNKKVGSAPGKNIARGQQIGKAEKEKGPGGNKAGDEKGVEYYDVEITLEELAAYLFDSLELPDLERKNIQKIFEKKHQRHGYRSEGIRPRLDKKQTIKKKLKRKAASRRVGTHEGEPGNNEDEERFPFHQDDLRYRHIKPVIKSTSSAVIFFMMDISGSMGKEKKYLARSFFFLLYQFIRHRYENVEIVFVAHDTMAYEVNEQQFFTRGQGGGTIVSSGLEMILEIIEKRFHPNSWNIYSFHCSDGDNWPSDMDKSIKLSERLKELSQLYSYCQIVPEDDRIRWARDDENTLAGAYGHMEDSAFKIVQIHSAPDIWPAFKKLFGGKLGV